MEGMDELLDREITKEQREEGRKAAEDLLLATGNYVTRPALTLTVQQSEREETRGRTEYRYFAQVESETGERGGIGFTLSPERRDTPTGKPDQRYQLWLQADKAFTLANGREATSQREIVEYVRDYPLTLRITRLPATDRFDASNQVRRISNRG